VLTPGRTAPLRRSDFVLAVILFAAASVAALHIMRDYVAHGGAPFFNQNFFGPAVLSACDRGFVNPRPGAVPALDRFLAQGAERFECADIPARVDTERLYPFQRSSLLLEASVSAVWRVTGVSWRSADILNALLFGCSIAAAFLLARSVAGRLCSVAVAALWAASPLHLSMLPFLRDYSKTAFVVGGVAVLAQLPRAASARRVYALAALFAANCAIGFGFRTDLLLLAAIGFVAVPLLAPLPARGRVTAAAIVALISAAVAVPLGRGYAEGGNLGHVIVLGQMAPFDATLGLGTPVYAAGYAYHDVYAFALVRDQIVRSGDAQAPAALRDLTPEESARFTATERSARGAAYDRATWHYLRVLAEVTPYDQLLRLLAAGRGSVALGFTAGFRAVPAWLSWPPAVEAVLLRAPIARVYAFVLPLAMIVAFVGLWRAGRTLCLGTLAVAAGLAASGALQYHERHVFYMELLAILTVSWMLSRLRPRPAIAALFAVPSRRTVEAVAMLGCAVVACIVALAVARATQQRRLTRLFESYERAPSQPVSWSATRSAAGALITGTLPPAGSRLPFSALTFARERCPAALFAVTARYASPDPANDFSYRRYVDMRSSARVRLYFPVAEAPSLGVRFAGWEMDPSVVSCLRGWDLLRVDTDVPELVAQLADGWRDRPLRRSFTAAVGAHIGGQAVYSTDPDTPIARALLEAPITAGTLATLPGRESNAYVAASDVAHLETGDVYVVEGSTADGGVVAGLQSADRWVKTVEVTAGGSFLIVLRVPAAGEYRAVLANGGTTASRHLHIWRSGWVRASAQRLPDTAKSAFGDAVPIR
jgi:hypothetical protein